MHRHRRPPHHRHVWLVGAVAERVIDRLERLDIGEILQPWALNNLHNSIQSGSIRKVVPNPKSVQLGADGESFFSCHPRSLRDLCSPRRLAAVEYSDLSGHVGSTSIPGSASSGTLSLARLLRPYYSCPVRLFLFVLLVMDAAVVVGLGLPQTRADTRDTPAPTRATSLPSDDGFALCQTVFEGRAVSPTAVAITYLDSEVDRDITPDDVRAWFGDIELLSIDVYQLELGSGVRRVAFELQRSRWPEWGRVVRGVDGREACGRVRAALLAHKVGRPGPDDATERSRHDFELIYARRAKLYESIEWIGTVPQALEPTRFAALQTWLARDDKPRRGQ